MTDLNRQAAELGEYGSDPNEGGTPADPDVPEDGPEQPAEGEGTGPIPEQPLRAD